MKHQKRAWPKKGIPSIVLYLGAMLCMICILIGVVLFEQGSPLMNGLVLLSAIVFFCYRAVKTLRWWRAEHPPRIRWFFSWFLPVLVLVVTIPHGIQDYVQAQPASKEDLLSVTDQMASLRQSKYTYNTQYTTSHHYYYSILLRSQKRLFLASAPDHRKMQKDFLLLAGEDLLTCLYDEDSTVYEITREDGTRLLNYEQSAQKLRAAAWVQLVRALALALLLAGGLTMLPAWLMAGDTFRARAWRWVGCGLVVGTLLLLGFLIRHTPNKPNIQDFPAYTSMEIPIGNKVTITLPPVGWRSVNPEDAYVWFQRQRGISSHFMLRDYSTNPPWNGTQAEWEQMVLEDSRQHLLDDFLSDPWSAWDPAPHEVRVWTRADGTPQVYSELWGDANDGSRNHFLLLPLFQQKVVVHFQSCSSPELDWEELRDYTQQWMFPLIDAMEAPPQQVTDISGR